MGTDTFKVNRKTDDGLRIDKKILSYKNIFHGDIPKHRDPVAILEKRFFVPLIDFVDTDTYFTCTNYIKDTLFIKPALAIEGIDKLDFTITNQTELDKLHESKDPYTSKIYIGATIVDSKENCLLFLDRRLNEYSFCTKPLFFDNRAFCCSFSQYIMHESFLLLSDRIDMVPKPDVKDKIDPYTIIIINACDNLYNYVDKTLMLTIYTVPDLNNFRITATDHIAHKYKTHIITREGLNSLCGNIPISNPWIDFFSRYFMNLSF